MGLSNSKLGTLWADFKAIARVNSIHPRLEVIAGTLWHGTARRTRRFMARPGTENLGTENLGTARHGKSWHGKIMARHGPKKIS